MASKLDLHHSVVELCAVVGSDAVSGTRWGRVDESGRAEVLSVDVLVEVSGDKRAGFGEKCLQSELVNTTLFVLTFKSWLVTVLASMFRTFTLRWLIAPETLVIAVATWVF